MIVSLDSTQRRNNEKECVHSWLEGTRPKTGGKGALHICSLGETTQTGAAAVVFCVCWMHLVVVEHANPDEETKKEKIF